MKINWTVLMILLLIVCLIGISLIFRVVRILNTEVDAPSHALAPNAINPTEAERQQENEQLMMKQKHRLKIIQLQERVNDQGEPAMPQKKDTLHNIPQRYNLMPQGGSRTE